MLPWIIGAAVVVLAWVFVIRPIVRPLPAFVATFDRIEAIERMLWAKSRMVLAARMVWVPSTILLIHDTLFSWAFDATPLLARALDSVPDDIRPQVVTLAIGLYGAAIEQLRRVTREPIEAKE